MSYQGFGTFLAPEIFRTRSLNLAAYLQVRGAMMINRVPTTSPGKWAWCLEHPEIQAFLAEYDQAQLICPKELMDARDSLKTFLPYPS